jgi:hypothetical protein
MWRSLVAHLTGGQGVAGSTPVIPTREGRRLARVSGPSSLARRVAPSEISPDDRSLGVPPWHVDRRSPSSRCGRRSVGQSRGASSRPPAVVAPPAPCKECGQANICSLRDTAGAITTKRRVDSRVAVLAAIGLESGGEAAVEQLPLPVQGAGRWLAVQLVYADGHWTSRARRRGRRLVSLGSACGCPRRYVRWFVGRSARTSDGTPSR